MRSVDDVLSYLVVDDAIGLDERTVKERQKQYGFNGKPNL